MQKTIVVASIDTSNVFHLEDFVSNFNVNKDVENMLTELSAPTSKQLPIGKLSQRTNSIRCVTHVILARILQLNDTGNYERNYKESLKALRSDTQKFKL